MDSIIGNSCAYSKGRSQISDRIFDLENLECTAWGSKLLGVGFLSASLGRANRRWHLIVLWFNP